MGIIFLIDTRNDIVLGFNNYRFVKQIKIVRVRSVFEKTDAFIKKMCNVFRHEKNKHYPDYQLINLLIITQFYPPDYAATGQLIQELATQLGKQKNINISVFTGQPGYAYAKADAPSKQIENNVTVTRTRATRMWSRRVRGKTVNGVIFTLRAALHVIRNGYKIDTLLLTTAPPFLSIIGYLGNLLFGISYVCLVYDLYPEVVTELNVSSKDSPVIKLWHRVNRLVWHKAQHIVVISPSMKQRLLSKYPDLERKTSVISNWADPEQIKPLNKTENWFAKEHQTDRKFTVLYSGNLGRCHDAQTILEVMKLLQYELIQFVFIGSGAKYESCRQQSSELSLTNCLFLPFQPKEVLPYSLTSADLALVSIAPGMEGVVAPSKLYGVMAAGVAIAAICEPHSYLRSLLPDVGCGACFDNNDAEQLAEFIRQLAKDSQRAKDMGIKGRKYLLKNFTPQIIAQKYAEIIQN